MTDFSATKGRKESNINLLGFFRHPGTDALMGMAFAHFPVMKRAISITGFSVIGGFCGGGVAWLVVALYCRDFTVGFSFENLSAKMRA